MKPHQVVYLFVVFFAIAALRDQLPVLATPAYGVFTAAMLAAVATWPLWRGASHPVWRVIGSGVAAVVLVRVTDHVGARHSAVYDYGFIVFAILGPVLLVLSYVLERRRAHS